MFWSLMSGSQEEAKGKMMREEEHWPFKSPRSCFSWCVLGASHNNGALATRARAFLSAPL